MKAILLSSLSIWFCLSLTAQIEFLVSVDPSDASFVKIQDINEVEWIQVGPSMTTLNEIDGHYIFTGIDNTNTKRLFSIDVSDGQTIYIPQFPVLTDPMDNVAQLQMDNKNNRLYGLIWDNSDQQEYFIEIDQQTGVITYISVIPDVQYIVILPNALTFDKDKGYYFFHGVTFSGQQKLYTIDVTDGSVVNSIDFPVLPEPGDNVGYLQYNYVDSTMYALQWDASTSTQYFGSIDLATGVFSPLNPINDITGIVGIPHYTTLDSNSGRYFFYAATSSGLFRLYTIDIYSGAVIYSPEFPILDDPDDNLKELKFNNADGTLYGLHWDASWVQDTTIMDTTVMDTTVIDTTVMDTTMIDTSTHLIDFLEEESVMVYPNPVAESGTLYLRNSGRHFIEIFDLQGKIYLQEEYSISDNTIQLDFSNFPQGNYIGKVSQEDGSSLLKADTFRFIKI